MERKYPKQIRFYIPPEEEYIYEEKALEKMVKRAGYKSLSAFFRAKAKEFFIHNNVRQKTLTKFQDPSEINRPDPFGCGKFIARRGLEVACNNSTDLISIVFCRTMCSFRRKLDYVKKHAE